MHLFRALAGHGTDTATAPPSVPAHKPKPSRTTLQPAALEDLLAAVTEAGATLWVSGDDITVDPATPTLSALLDAAVPKLLEELHARSAWTGDISRRAAEQTAAILAKARVEPVLVNTTAGVEAMLAALPEVDTPIGLDIETCPAEGRPRYALRIAKRGDRLLKDQPGPDTSAALDPFRAEVRTVQLYWGGGAVYVIDLDWVDPALLAPVWFHPLAAHNAQFEARMLRATLGVELPRLMDTMLGAGLVYRGDPNWRVEGTRRPSLARAAADAWGIEVPKAGATSDWSRPTLTPAQVDYAALDAVLALHLATTIAKLLDQTAHGDRIREAWDRANRALAAAVDIELNGVFVDRRVHAPLCAEWQRDAAKLAYRIEHELGIRPGSRDIVGWLNRNLPDNERRNWPRTDSGLLSTQGKHLRRLIGVVEGADLLADYARLTAYDSHFGFGMLEKIHPKTGRLHTSFNLCRAKSGRASSSGPNLQNIPSDPRMRAAIVAPKGRRLVGGDYGQLELRVLAHITKDERLTRMFRAGVDAHSAVAAEMLGLPLEDLDPEHNPDHKLSRKKAKALNFGIAYGAQAKGIQAIARDQHGVVMTVAEAEHYRETWLRQYPQVARWQERQIERTKVSRTVRTVGGRPYKFDWEAFRSYRATLAVNLPVQGTAADIAMETMALLPARVATLPAELILQVHDEFLLECDDDPVVVEQVTAVLEQAMVEGFLALLPDAPTVGLCDIADGANWAEVH